LNGPYGNVSQAKWSNGTSMTLSPSVNPTVKGVVYNTGSAFGNANVMCAYSRYGKGKVAAMGDSSPFDDSTGDPNDQLYDGWITDAAGNHQKLIMNATIWLVAKSTASVPGIENNVNFIAYPNPSTEVLSFKSLGKEPLSTAVLYDLFGNEIAYQSFNTNNSAEVNVSTLANGIYYARLFDINKNQAGIKKIVVQH
jgi:hypothetical protein